MLSPIQRLKIDLMTDGLSVSDRARREMSGGDENRPLTLADYASTSGISLRLEDDIWVNAPIHDFNPNFVDAPPHLLDWDGERFFVRSGVLEVEAEPVPVPDYHDEKNRWGEPYTSFAITHTDRVRISPIEGCAIVCKFCDLPYEFRYRKKPIEGLVDSVRRALDDRRLPAQHVLISGGTPRSQDYEYQHQVYEAVTSAFPGIDIDIMMVPNPGLLDLHHLKRIGVHGLSINLEIYNQERANEIMPLKARLTRDYYLNFIEEAVEVFGVGRVRSLLLVGLESMQDTLRGVEALMERGCEPVLSPFRPDPSTPLRGMKPPRAEFLVECYQRSREIVAIAASSLGPRCIPCQHNTLTFPDIDGLHYHTARRLQDATLA